MSSCLGEGRDVGTLRKNGKAEMRVKRNGENAHEEREVNAMSAHDLANPVCWQRRESGDREGRRSWQREEDVDLLEGLGQLQIAQKGDQVKKVEMSKKTEGGKEVRGCTNHRSHELARF